jgi:hypothetical protein
MEDDMRPYMFVAFLLLLGAAVQEPARAQGDSAATSVAGTVPEGETRDPGREIHGAAREIHRPARETRPPDGEHHDMMGSHGDHQAGGEYPGYSDYPYVITQAPGYILTPMGQLIFPAAQPPAGDTSTLSGAGPNVSTGPVVGSGPEVSSGPEIGSDLDYPKAPVTGTAP